MMMMMSCRKSKKYVKWRRFHNVFPIILSSWAGAHMWDSWDRSRCCCWCVWMSERFHYTTSRAQHSSPSWYISSWLLGSVSCFYFSYTGSCVSSLLARSSRQRSMTGRSNRQVEVMLKVINYFYTMSRRLETERGWRCLHGTKWLLS